MSTFESLTMEESSLNHQNGVQMAPQGGSVPNNKQGEEGNPKAQYSIPGILHFIQHEWARFELERSQWEVDRAELQVHIVVARYARCPNLLFRFLTFKRLTVTGNVIFFCYRKCNIMRYTLV